MDLVSVIIPVYNGESFLSDTLESIVNQTYQEMEIIIVNDNSDDNTSDVIDSFDDKRLVVINNTVNLGVAKSRNIGIENSTGYYVAFCDADDLWVKDKLQKQIESFNEDVGIVCSDYSVFNELTGYKKIVKYDGAKEFSELLKTNFIPNSSAIVRRTLIGSIRQESKGHEDYIFWLSLLSANPQFKVVRLNEVLMMYRVHEKSLSRNKFRAVIWQWRIYRNTLRIGVLRSLYYWVYYIINALGK
jgi:glycosyltransferase involved in cell wall biosynthesis